jgi:hypothetical protein
MHIEISVFITLSALSGFSDLSPRHTPPIDYAISASLITPIVAAAVCLVVGLILRAYLHKSESNLRLMMGGVVFDEAAGH